jgi:hypothetical protein
MKYIAILAAFAVTFVGSSSATSIHKQHGRKLGKKSLGKKSKEPKTYFSPLNAAQRTDECSVTSPGIGNAVLTYTDDSLCYKITYSGLSGPETVAHIHGPAMVGVGAGVLFAFDSTIPTPDIKDGCFALTDQDMDLVKEYLDDGLLYINIHSEACPKGEIRGQIFAT